MPRLRGLPLLVTCCVLLLGLHATVAEWPQELVHGVDASRGFGALRLIWLGAAVALIVPPEPRRALARAWVRVEAWLDAARPRRTMLLGSAWAVALLLLRDRALVGDGRMLVARLSGEAWPEIRRPLDDVVHVGFHRLFRVAGFDAPLATYVLVSALGGLVWLAAAVALARGVGRTDGERRLVLAATLATGALPVWFGHVETYALSTAALAVALALAVHGRDVLAAGALGLSGAFHGSGLFAGLLLPALVGRRLAAGDVRAALAAPLAWATPVALGVALVLRHHPSVASMAGDVPGQLTGRAFRPLWEPVGHYAPVLSAQHALDVLNHVTLMAPLWGVALVLVALRPRTAPRSPAVLPLALASAGLLLLAATWMFEFDAALDWDIVAILGVPLAPLTGLLAAARLDPEEHDEAAVVWAVTGAAIVAPWVVGLALGYPP